MLRTHTCGELRKSHLGKTVQLAGWVNRVRNLGGVLFLELRDRYGETQVLISPEKDEAMHKLVLSISPESVVHVTGTVKAREEHVVNKDMPTGEIEVVPDEIEVLNSAKPMPFEVNVEREQSEDLRLKYRYIDLRRPSIQRNMIVRSNFIKAIRDFMHGEGFVEVQTPILTASSPEGARDFVVPSRIHPGKFYALPQAPQQYKQLLMVAGFDKYYQIAPCMRDEDPRADRSPGEFYQLDLEMSFVDEEDVWGVIERMSQYVVKEVTDKKIWKFPFPRYSYDEVMLKYGSDKPDLRYGVEIADVTALAKQSEFKIFTAAESVRALSVPAELSRKDVSDLELVAKANHAKGLAYGVVKGNTFESSISKFFTPGQQAELIQAVGAKAGETLVFVADAPAVCAKALGAVRLAVGKKYQLADPNLLAFAWVTDFPFFEWSESENRLDFMHNPFSAPVGGMSALEGQDPLTIRARQYDWICNGLELASGAIRNHDPKALLKAFEMVGYPEKEVRAKFGHMMEAFELGAPPHGGIAPGIDRFLMACFGFEYIRDVVPFPKNQKAEDPMMGAPSELNDKQLKDLHIKLAK